MPALPPAKKYLDALRAAGIRTGTARGFWGGVTEGGEVVVTTWIDGGAGPDRFWIWEPPTNHGGLRDEWRVGNIRAGALVKLILVHQRGNIPLDDRSSPDVDRRPARRQVAGARLMPGLWRVVEVKPDPNGWPGAIIERVEEAADAKPMAA
jgi:hypothetical protein